MYRCEILADSVGAHYEDRLTTMLWEYPLIIHNEVLTHRTHSRNSASTRAIPNKVLLDKVRVDPFVPIHWGKNQSGMQARAVLDHNEQHQCEQVWLDASYAAIRTAETLASHGLHKQVANRVLMPFMWMTTILTSSQRGWLHLFDQRCHEDADPHFQRIARMAEGVYDLSLPKTLQRGQWHLPLTGFPGDEELGPDVLARVSAARCARVSYLTHDGTRDISADIALHDRLATAKPPHLSPLEHVAQYNPEVGAGLVSNIAPCWVQLRKLVKDEFHAGE